MRAALVKSSQVKSSHFRPLDFHHCWPPQSTFDRLPYVGPCVCGYVCCLYRLDLIGYPYRICVCCLCIYRLDLTALPLGSKYQVATQCHSRIPQSGVSEATWLTGRAAEPRSAASGPARRTVHGRHASDRELSARVRRRVSRCVSVCVYGGRGRGLARQSLLRCVAHVDCIYRLFWKGWSAPWSRRHDQACSIGSSGTAPSAPSMELTLYTVTSCAPTWRMS